MPAQPGLNPIIVFIFSNWLDLCSGRGEVISKGVQAEPGSAVMLRDALCGNGFPGLGAKLHSWVFSQHLLLAQGVVELLDVGEEQDPCWTLPQGAMGVCWPLGFYTNPPLKQCLVWAPWQCTCTVLLNG